MQKVIVVIALVLAALTCLGALSCDKLMIKGRVAGTVMTASGAPYGYTTVVLIDVKTNAETDRENATDSGNFIIDGVPPGEYSVKVLGMGGNEIPLLEPIKFKLSMGMTKNLKVMVGD